MTTTTILIFSILISLQTFTDSSDICIDKCDMYLCTQNILSCTLRHTIFELPEIPTNIQQIVISYQRLSHPHITYNNLSQYGSAQIKLTHLSITFTNLKSIEPESFSHLVALKYVDLSNNKLLSIQPSTFKGSYWNTLKLNKNPNLKLVPLSFKGLLVTNLYLNYCNFNKLSFPIINDLLGHLNYLDISYNSLTKLDNDFHKVFDSVKKIKLIGNPINCNCNSTWLIKKIKSKNHKNSSNSPACNQPSELKGRLLINLMETNLICRLPAIKQVNINLNANQTGELYCAAANKLESSVEWKQKKFTIKQQFYNWIDYKKSVGSSSIKIKEESKIDHYSCYVENSQGQVSVEINIAWPQLKANIVNTKSKTGKKNSVHYTTFQTEYNNTPFAPYTVSPLLMKSYSLFDLLLSIFGTMIATGLLSSFFFVCICHRKHTLSSSSLWYNTRLCCCYADHDNKTEYPRSKLSNSQSRETEHINESALSIPDHYNQVSTINPAMLSQYPSCHSIQPSQLPPPPPPTLPQPIYPTTQNFNPQHLIDFRTQQALPLASSYSNWSLKI